MYLIFVLLGLIISFILFFTGIRTKNSDIISIGSVLSIFFLLIFINIYMPQIVHDLQTGSLNIPKPW